MKNMRKTWTTKRTRAKTSRRKSLPAAPARSASRSVRLPAPPRRPARLLPRRPSTNKDTARRLVDFLSGCAYALDGKIKKVAMSTYIITPYNVDIVGDLMEEIEKSGAYV